MTPAEISVKPPCTRQDAMIVLERLREAGHVAYFAGGCVRDLLLGLEPKDWDVATDAPPDRIREIFSSTQAVGASFGVILVRIRKSQVEVATFRADGTYTDGRHPDSVRFTSAQEDARRRDFTINGLFLDPIENRVIDYVGGREDLARKQIRAIGQPRDRFAEDHLRLLRAVRFAARFAFEIEPETAAAISELAPRIKSIFPERIGDEIRLMLTPQTRTVAWQLLWDLGLGREIFRFLPMLPERMAIDRSLFLKLSPQSASSMGLSLAAASLCVSLQAKWRDDLSPLLSKPEIGKWVRAMRQALRISNEQSDEMAGTLEALEPLLRSDPPTLAQKKRFLARATASRSMEMMKAISLLGLHGDRIASLLAELQELARSEVAPPPLITGDDLIAAGVRPGPVYKRILESVYDAQLEGNLKSKAEALEMAERLRST